MDPVVGVTPACVVLRAGGWLIYCVWACVVFVVVEEELEEFRMNSAEFENEWKARQQSEETEGLHCSDHQIE